MVVPRFCVTRTVLFTSHPTFKIKIRLLKTDKMVTHKLIVLRHGELEWNHENKFCGWIDVPLSEKGRQEAKFAAQLIQKHNLKPAITYTSKLTRSIQTGDIILEEIKRLWCDVVKTWRLNERHYGAFQGRDKNEVYLELGAEKYQYIRRDYNGTPPPVEAQSKDECIDERYTLDNANLSELPRGESLKMVMDRVIPYLQSEIVEQSMIGSKKTVLLVTHGSIVRSVIKHFKGVSDADISKINVPTGVPMVFELDDDCNLIKDYYYLDPELAQKGIEKVRNEGIKK